MAVERIGTFIKEKRLEFGKMLRNDEHEIMEFISKALEECCGKFDEECLAENLKEEFELFLEEMEK